MFGYEPRKPEREPGSWAEILVMMRVVFSELARPLLVIFVTLALVLGTLILFFTNPPLALVPLAIIAGLAWWLVRRDARTARDAEDLLPPPHR